MTCGKKAACDLTVELQVQLKKSLACKNMSGVLTVTKLFSVIMLFHIDFPAFL